MVIAELIRELPELMRSIPNTETSAAMSSCRVQQTRGFDFTAYKRTSLMRRVLRRMQTVGVDSYEAYYDYLQVHQEEFAALFNTILINVTGFFRDQDVWNYLEKTVLPAVLAERRPDEPFRVWSAGCASGQEAYSILMVLGEILGFEAVRERVKIYATDADEEALAEARSGTFPEKSIEDVPAPLREKYFDRGPAGSPLSVNCAARSSSDATTWYRTRRSRAWTSFCVAIP